MEGVVRAMARGGDAAVLTDQGIVFAHGALPGERVRLGSVTRRRGAATAEVVEILAAAPERVSPPCPRFSRCGGCTWMHGAPEAQAEWKRAFLEEALDRAGQRAGVDVTCAPAPTALGYRRRARLAWHAGPGETRVGYRHRRSHAIEDAPDCAVLTPALEAGLDRLRAVLAPFLAGVGEASLSEGAAGGLALVLETADSQPAEAYGAAAALAGETGVAGVALMVEGVGAPATWGDPRDVYEGFDGAPMVGTIGGFSQAHGAVNKALVARVAEWAEPSDARVLEFHAGSGNLTVALAPDAASTVAVELDQGAADACRANLANRGITGVRVVAADAAACTAERSPDVVVLNPPRTGAAEAVGPIVKRRPARIVYVSCDTGTLARDLKAFGAAGYVVDAACGYDMFPQTAHLESVVRLRRE